MHHFDIAKQDYSKLKTSFVEFISEKQIAANLNDKAVWIGINTNEDAHLFLVYLLEKNIETFADGTSVAEYLTYLKVA